MGKEHEQAATKEEQLQRIYVGLVEVEVTYHMVRNTQLSATRRYQRGVTSRFSYEVELEQTRRHYQRLDKLLAILQARYEAVISLP